MKKWSHWMNIKEAWDEAKFRATQDPEFGRSAVKEFLLMMVFEYLVPIPCIVWGHSFYSDTPKKSGTANIHCRRCGYSRTIRR